MHQTARHPLAHSVWPPQASADERAGWPVILVLEHRPSLAPRLEELFEALCIRLHSLHAKADPGPALHHHQPIAVLAQLAPDDHAWLAAIARHDAALPVMVITDPPADAIRAAGDSGVAPLVNMVWMPHPPGMRLVVEFLAMAERRAK